MGSSGRVVARVGAAGGGTLDVAAGDAVVFGRGPDVDLPVAAGRGLSRRAGVIAALGDGVLVTNVSRTHALYVVGPAYRIRLPRLEGGDEPPGGWYARSGTLEVGSQAMLDEGGPLVVELVRAGAGAGPDDGARVTGPHGDPTLLPLRLDPDTKLFLVALM